jgi:3-oxoacyl-(acyl-carrier-protein) synthase
MVMGRRVVVTGVGAVSPIGIGKEDFWKGLISGECGVGYVTHFDASSYPCRFAAEVKNFQPTDFISPKMLKSISSKKILTELDCASARPWDQRIFMKDSARPFMYAV